MTRSVFVVLLALLFSAVPLTHAAVNPGERTVSSITVPAGSTLELLNTRVAWMKSTQAGDTLYLQVSEYLRRPTAGSAEK